MMERTANMKINVGELDICQPMNVGELDIKTYHIPGLRLIEDGSLRLSSFGLRFLR
jgi:hypothetical protein